MKRMGENNNESGMPIVKKKNSLSLPKEFMGQMKWKLWLIKNYEHKVDATTSLASTLCSASKETFGRKPSLPNILGKLFSLSAFPTRYYFLPIASPLAR